MFNVFYEDLIDNISHSDRGISLRGETYNVFCYADDLLITSTTVSGLQSLIDMCDSYMVDSHETASNKFLLSAPFNIFFIMMHMK